MRRRWPALAALLVAASLSAAADKDVPAASRATPPEAAIRAGRCPPGTVAYTDGGSHIVKCVAAPTCGPAQTSDAAGHCVCPPGKVAVRHGAEPQQVQCVEPPPCGAGLARDAATGECRCPPGQKLYRRGGGGPPQCVAAGKACPPGATLDAASGQCLCPPGTRMYRSGAGGGGCVPASG
jgi:hypothetical protein